MQTWKTKGYFLGPAGHKMKVLDMAYVGAMPEAAPAIRVNVLQSPRNSSNLAI